MVVSGKLIGVSFACNCVCVCVCVCYQLVDLGLENTVVTSGSQPLSYQKQLLGNDLGYFKDMGYFKDLGYFKEWDTPEPSKFFFTTIIRVELVKGMYHYYYIK